MLFIVMYVGQNPHFLLFVDMKHLGSILIALALLLGAKAFAQEWEYSIGYHLMDDVMTRQYCTYEMSDGRVVVSAAFLYNDGSTYPFYPPHNALIALSPDGAVLAQADYFKSGYWGSSYNPYVFESEDGELYALMSFSPDHDSNYFNYFLNYDNPPIDAILGLYKLNDNLQIEQSYEYSFPIDTFDVTGYYSCESSGSIHIHSAINDEGNIVGVYTKNVSYDYNNSHGFDSLFFFRMNYEGELLANVGYELPYSGEPWQMLFWREQLVKTDYGYIYYSNRNNVPPSPNNASVNRAYAGTVAYLDKDFNLMRTRQLVHPGGNGNDQYLFDDVSIVRSRHNTTYLATRSSRYYDESMDDCFLYELNDDIGGVEDIVPIVLETERKTEDFDFVADSRAVTLMDNYSLLYCYSLNVGFFPYEKDSWIVIEKLDEDFNTLSTVYYSNDYDRLWCAAASITAARDGGVFLTLNSKKLDSYDRATSVVKFPAEAFVGIEEAHDNGLKVAVAYPNPGKDVLNIRTGLRDAWVEVYDSNGRLIHSQALTENVTGIDAGDWAEGIYVWKVMAEGKEAECGKWVKE